LTEPAWWRAWVIAVGAAVVALGGAGATLKAQSIGDTAGTDAAAVTAATGEQTYREICQACHMANAEGGMGAGKIPALASNPHLAAEDFVIDRVLRGRGGMPAFADMLSAEQIAGVVGYVRTHFGNSYNGSVTDEEVKRLSPKTGKN
jgi:mono/diheme cytochrome c family protein